MGALPRPDLPRHPIAPSDLLPIADAAAGQDPANLPGTWRRLEGGLGLKVPDVLIIERETVRRARGVVRQELHGRTRAGKDGVGFGFAVELAPDRNLQNIGELIAREPDKASFYGGQAVQANGLWLHRTDQIGAVTESYNGETFTRRGVRHQYSEKSIQVTIDVGSRFEPDHLEVQALAQYALTLQRLAPPAAPPAGMVDSGRWQGQWRRLPGGLCILVPSSLLIEDETWEQPTIFAGNESRTINGATSSGIEYRLSARHSPRDKFPNMAGRMRVHTADTDIEPVSLAGLLFSRTSRVGGDRAEVSYQLMEGPYNIWLRITSPGPATNPELRELAAYAETIQHAPE